MQEDPKTGATPPGLKPQQISRKSVRVRLTEEQRELEQMQLERLRRLGPDRLWRSR